MNYLWDSGFLFANSVLHNQQGEARFKEINWENFMEASSFKKGEGGEGAGKLLTKERGE